MNHNAAGKVHHAPLAEQALGVPSAVGQRTIDEEAEEHHEHQIGRELHTLGKGAGDERRGNDGKSLKLLHSLCVFVLANSENLSTD